MATVQAFPEFQASEISPTTPRVALLVGSNDALHCGVKDYARKLAEVLGEHNLRADVLAPPSWERTRFMRFFKDYLRGRYDLFHLQYPSIGMKASLMPHAFGLMGGRRRTLVTFHEFSALPFSQRTSLHLFRATVGTILLSTEFERAAMNRNFGALGAKQRVIPIGSNIPAAPISADIFPEVIYFGQIRPNKGIETFVHLAQMCAAEGKSYRFRALGSVPSSRKQYAESLAATAGSSVYWSYDLEESEVARILARSLAAYLPYPDGVSERRGSLLAAFANGIPVISQFGPASTSTLKKLVLCASEPREALAILERLHKRPELRREQEESARNYVVERSWASVAGRHLAIYEELYGKRVRATTWRTIGGEQSSVG
jgi:glycosyltransferase involved in cell wall biosynthesis